MIFLIILAAAGLVVGIWLGIRETNYPCFKKIQKFGTSFFLGIAMMVLFSTLYLLIGILPINVYLFSHPPITEPKGEIIRYTLRELPGTENSYITNSDFCGKYCYYVIDEHNFSHIIPEDNANIEFNLCAALVEEQPCQIKNPVLRFFFVPLFVDINEYTLYLPNIDIDYNYNVNNIGD